MKKWMTIGALAFAVVVADASIAGAQDGFIDENVDGVDDGAAYVHRAGRRGGLRGVRSQLTAEQQAVVKAAMDGLKETGATREELHASLTVILAGYGVELPERGDRLAQRLDGVLAEEELAELRTKMDALRESGASREDMRAAMEAELGEFGVDPSAIQGRGDRKDGRRGYGKFRGRRSGFHVPAPAPAEAPAVDDAS